MAKKSTKTIWVRTITPWHEDGTDHPVGAELEREEVAARAVIANGAAVEIPAPAPPAADQG
jgi:hypothetical protein